VAKPASVGRGPRQTGITDYDVRRDFASAEQEMCNRLDNVHHFEASQWNVVHVTVVARNKVAGGFQLRPSNRVRTTIVTPTKGAKTSWWKPDRVCCPGSGRSITHSTSATHRHGHERHTAQRPARARAEGLRHRRHSEPGVHGCGAARARAHAICYIEVGSAGNYYSTAQEGIASTYYAQYQAAGCWATRSRVTRALPHINSPATVRITEAMIAQQCAAKGFDAVETDLDETYSRLDGASGFSLTQGDEVAYMTKLADYMHRLGLGWVIKNPDDTGDNYATLMEPLADAVLTEQCNEYSTCSALSAYLGHKAIFNAEYNLSTASFCRVTSPPESTVRSSRWRSTERAVPVSESEHTPTKVIIGQTATARLHSRERTAELLRRPRAVLECQRSAR